LFARAPTQTGSARFPRTSPIPFSPGSISLFEFQSPPARLKCSFLAVLSRVHPPLRIPFKLDHPSLFASLIQLSIPVLSLHDPFPPGQGRIRFRLFSSLTRWNFFTPSLSFLPGAFVKCVMASSCPRSFFRRTRRSKPPRWSPPSQENRRPLSQALFSHSLVFDRAADVYVAIPAWLLLQRKSSPTLHIFEFLPAGPSPEKDYEHVVLYSGDGSRQ